MAILDIFKLTRKTFFNPSGWLNISGIKNQSTYIWRNIRQLVVPPQPESTESYDEALIRHQLKQEDERSLSRSFSHYTWFFTLISFALFIYSFYILFRHHSFTGWLLGMAVTAFTLAQAFKYDFWGFQIQEKKLGLTFADWKAYRLGLKRPS